jgi:peptide/nickel transport system substrate-binding protein
MLAERAVAGKRRHMRRWLALLAITLIGLVPTSCRQQPQGTVNVVVIGDQPKLRDPAAGALAASDAVLLQNIAQGLVRFDAAGNIVGGLAERWNVSDDGLSYIFRLAPIQWADGRKVTAEQVARILKRQLGGRSRNPLKDTVGAIVDVLPMTERVIQIELVAPRPNLLALLAQPEFAVLRGNYGTGPFQPVSNRGPAGEIRLARQVSLGEEEEPRHEEALLSGAPAARAVAAFAAGHTDLVLGGTFADLDITRRVRLPNGALRFDPASGLFGLVPTHAGGPFDSAEARRLLSEAFDRANFVGRLGVPGLAARATLLEPGLDGVSVVPQPAWFSRPPAERVAALQLDARRLFKTRPVARVALPSGPGGDLLLLELKRDWGALGVDVVRADEPGTADFTLIDEVAPSSSPAWFVRRFRCGTVAVCDVQADALTDAARQMPVPAQRYALLTQAAARIEDAQLFIPITAPVRWSLVSPRIQNFAGNRYARHTLTDLEQQSASD